MAVDIITCKLNRYFRRKLLYSLKIFAQQPLIPGGCSKWEFVSPCLSPGNKQPWEAASLAVPLWRGDVILRFIVSVLLPSWYSLLNLYISKKNILQNLFRSLTPVTDIVRQLRNALPQQSEKSSTLQLLLIWELKIYIYTYKHDSINNFQKLMQHNFSIIMIVK